MNEVPIMKMIMCIGCVSLLGLTLAGCDPKESSSTDPVGSPDSGTVNVARHDAGGTDETAVSADGSMVAVDGTETGTTVDVRPADQDATGTLLNDASADGAGGSGLARDRLVARLTPAEAALLCDALSNAQGGYGKTAMCADGHVEENDPNLPDCVRALIDAAQALQQCGLTVGESEDCARTVGTELCRFPTAPECAPVRACGS
jgi:hypothetical protein